MKSPFLIALAGDVEASYLSGGVVDPATMGQQLAEPAAFTLGRAFDGTRAAPPGTLGYQKRTIPNGSTLSTTFKVEPKPSGVAYSASVKPAHHALRRASCFDYAVTVTPGLEKWVGTPHADPASAGSGFFDAYAFGEKYPLTGLFADWTIGADGPVIPTEEFAVQALLGAVDDAALPPGIVYPYDTIQPILSVGAGLFSIGLFVGAVLKKWQIKGTRSITPILNQNGGGHAGFRFGRWTPQMTCSFETPAKVGAPYHAASTIDPKRLFEAGTELAWAVQLGSVQYNRRKLSGPKAQVMKDPETVADGNSTVTTLTLQLNPSALGQNDEVTDTWD